MSQTAGISKITAQEILDSSGVPTVQVKLELDNGLQAKASVPSGTSTGAHEARELRDGDMNRYQGMGVRQAISNTEEVLNKGLHGLEVTRQQELDEEMQQLDGTENLRKLGANAVLAVSLAAARAAALALNKPLYRYLAEDLMKQGQAAGKTLPVPMFNIFNGGKHADTNLDFQEFIIIPAGIDGGFTEQLRAGAEVFHILKEVLLANDLDTDVGTEGGYAPNIDDTMQALDLIMEAIKKSDYNSGQEIQLGMDVGASVLYNHDKNSYHFGLMDHEMTASQLISLYQDWVRQYPFTFIEDGLAEDDWQNWQLLAKEAAALSHDYTEKELKRQLLIAGDDLFATNVSRLQAGIEQQAANCVIAKPNQIGTLSKTLEFIELAKKNDYKVVISHRSGETCDTFISDLAYAVAADYIKAGSLSRGERVVKYNRLLEIERELQLAK